MSTCIQHIVFKPVETDEELRLANDLMAKVHFQDYFAAIQWLETCGAGYPGFLREHTRIGVHKGEIAAALRLNTETLRIGEARLKLGGFGWVTTAPRYRNRGIARALMQDTLHYLKQHRYDVTMLFGIPNFYHKLGFVSTLAEYTVTVDAAEGARIPCDLKERAAKPGDIPALQKIHALNDIQVACSLVRSSAHITNRWEQWYKDLRVLTNDQGKVGAYFHPAADANVLEVREVGVADPAACSPLLGACAAAAAERSAARIRFYTPPDHPFARFLLQIKSTHEMHVVRDSGGMMSLVDIGEALEHMIPEWESLLARSAARDLRTEFTLLVAHTPYRIRANRGAIDVSSTPASNKVSMNPQDLVHVLTGYLHLEDILSARRRLIKEDAKALLFALFPKREPYVWPLDRF